jgi:hypothetical protein
MADLLKNLESILTIVTLVILGAGAILGTLKGKKFSLKSVELPPVPIKLPEGTEKRLEAIEETLARIEENTRPDGGGLPLAPPTPLPDP